MTDKQDLGPTWKALTRWVEAGWMRSLDLALARFLIDKLAGNDPPASPLLALGIALTSHQVGRGHVCLDLGQLGEQTDAVLSLPPEHRWSDDPPPMPSQLLEGVGLADWLEALTGTPLVGGDGDHAPLVLSGSRLYLRRYHGYEQLIAGRILSRLAKPTAEADLSSEQAQALRSALAVLFPHATGQIDWQRAACALAARSAFAIITGGPGTGKTTTVLRLLAALQSVAMSVQGRALRIRLAAPTGKAAARLNESIAASVASLALAGLEQPARLRESIPTEVSTVHRLLGSRPDTRRFVHGPDNPLALDVLVVDEASMVDVELMASLLQALPCGARLVLLGDKDQLASVDAGAVLGDLCQQVEQGGYSPELAKWLAAVSGDHLPESMIADNPEPIDQCVASLRVSYRFAADSGIGQLADAVRQGQAGHLNEQGLFSPGRFNDIALLRPAGEDDPQLLRYFLDGSGQAAVVGHAACVELMRRSQPALDAGQAALDAWALSLLQALSRFQLLCALRTGPWGVEQVNQQVARALMRRGLIERSEGWYAGRPVLVTQNDYALGLMNGDIGLVLATPDLDASTARLRVAFPAGDGSGGVRWVLPSRLQQVETVYAMTVHKSQGSEFEHVCLVLPERSAPVLTRELLYTGITRARRCFSLVAANPSLLQQAAKSPVLRASGLAEALRRKG